MLFIHILSRLAARGDELAENIFNQDSSSPTVNVISIFIALSIASKNKCKIRTSDVPGAFLHATLQKGDHIFMKLPRDCADIWCEVSGQKKSEIIHEDGYIYVKLSKALYGLKQASALWYEVLKKFFISVGYRTSKSDPCVFFKREDSDFCLALIHVDDILEISTSEVMLDELDQTLSTEYGNIASQQRGNSISFLSMLIEIDENGTIKLSQAAYIKKLLKEFNINENNRSNYPSNDRLFNASHPDSKICDKKLYLSMLMSLMYAAIRTRPDIIKEVTFLASRIQSPTDADMEKLLRVFYYLNVFPDRAMYFHCNPNNNQFVLYADASFNVHADTSGHSGVIGKLYGNTIIIQCGKQKTVTKSSTESELVALDTAATYVPWVCELLDELGFSHEIPVLIYQDNKSTIIMANAGGGSFKRTKHISNRYFWINQFINSGEIQLLYIPTDQMIADVLTKPLIGNRFYRLVAEIMNGGIEISTVSSDKSLSEI